MGSTIIRAFMGKGINKIITFRPTTTVASNMTVASWSFRGKRLPAIFVTVETVMSKNVILVYIRFLDILDQKHLICLSFRLVFPVKTQHRMARNCIKKCGRYFSVATCFYTPHTGKYVNIVQRVICKMSAISFKNKSKETRTRKIPLII